VSDGFATPEDAARGDIPARYARALAVSLSPDERFAAVLLATNEPPFLYPYLVLCEREDDGWVEGASANMSMAGELGEGNQTCRYVTQWQEAPPDARAAIVNFAAEEHVVPVRNGYVLFAAWNVAEEREWPAVMRWT
jgi:hypothetical protein